MEHKFFKIDDDWNIRCPETGGSFSTSLWRSEKIPNNYCPCCKRDISVELRSQKTRKQIAAGVQRSL